MERRDRDIAFIHRGKVGIRTGVVLFPRRTDPVQRIAARIFLRNDLIGRMAAAAAGNANTFYLIKRKIRDVDIENAPGTQRFAA